MINEFGIVQNVNINTQLLGSSSTVITAEDLDREDLTIDNLFHTNNNNNSYDEKSLEAKKPLQMFLSCKEHSKAERLMLKAVFVVFAGGSIFGYEIGIIGGGLGQLGDDLDIYDTIHASFLIGSISLGNVVGTIIGSFFSNNFGRWTSSSIQSFIFILGCIVMSNANNYNILLIGRILIGVAASFAASSSLPYLYEIAPPKYRGRFTSSYEISVSIGILVANIINFVVEKSNKWRTSFILPVIIACLQAFCLIFLPESVSWLINKGKLEQVSIVLSQMYVDPESAEDEFNSLKYKISKKINGNFNFFIKVIKLYSIPIIISGNNLINYVLFKNKHILLY
jgi:MFS family permease